MEIKVLGTGCPKCQRLEELTREAASDLGVEATFTKVKQMDDIMAYDALRPEAEQYGLMTTPLVVVGEEVVGAGKVVPADKLVSIIQNRLGG